MKQDKRSIVFTVLLVVFFIFFIINAFIVYGLLNNQSTSQPIPYIELIITFLIINALLFIIAVSMLVMSFRKNLKAMYTRVIEAEFKSTLDLPNLMFFNQIAKKELIRAFRNKKILGLLLVDIDQFHQITNKNIGDILIKELGLRFSASLRGSDIIAHYDHDKFIILLLDLVNNKFASPVADKLLNVTKQNFIINETTINIRVSIGISMFPEDGLTFDELLNHAKHALHEAKSAGGNSYQYYDIQMNRQAKAYSELENALNHAVDNNEMQLYFQPQLCLKERVIKSAEALIRWRNPEMGLISPEKFIPVAEQNGTILKLGQWVLFEACRINKAWQEQGYTPIKIAVNVSAIQFFEQDIFQIIKDALQQTGLEAKYLMLEITESVIMEDIELAIIILNRITNLGVEIAMDDFGTGYTSINYLKRFPLRQLKIDQNFVEGIPSNSHDTGITSALINLSHNLSLQTVAEGVERKEQLDFLIAHHCDMVQGDYISPALATSEFESQLRKN